MEKQITTRIIERQKIIFEQMQKIYQVKKQLSRITEHLRLVKQASSLGEDQTLFSQAGLIDDELTLSELRYEKMKLRLKIHRMEQDLELVR